MKFLKGILNNKESYFVEKDNKYFKVNGDIFDVESIEDESCEIEKILPPIMPTKIVALGLNYKMHVSEIKGKQPNNPVIFLKPVTTIIGQNDNIIAPKISQRVDYEAELAFFVKKDCKNVSVTEAKDYILGYTCLNDVTARDLQREDGQWTRAKSFDTFCPVGPYVVTDVDVSSLDIKTYLNGEVVQSGNTQDMIFNVYEILSYISSIMTLKKGDLISTGTPAGIGEMHSGDEVIVEIENIGALKNKFYR